MAEDVSPRRLRLIARREALVLLGAAGLTAVAACSGDSGTTASGNGGRRGSRSSATTSPPTSASTSAPTTAPATAVACVLSPEMTEGPYYIDGEAMRSDITEGKAGVSLRLELAVATVGGSTCRPLPGAAVDIWHADATGNYSGFGNTASNRTFLRGVQTTDANGKVTFRTIYPGWYPGRAVHIHVKVLTGGSDLHTGQLFFDDSVNGAVYAAPPYDSRAGQWMRNAQDGIYNNGGSQSIVTTTKEADGYFGTIVMGVRA